jgi:hypothetical protein
VSYVRFDDGDQDCFPVEENVLLVEAKDEAEALEKAKALGYENYDGDEVEWDERAAHYVFAGVRKVVECEASASTEPAATPAPGHGTELTYSYLELDTEEDLHLLLQGESVVASIDE